MADYTTLSNVKLALGSSQTADDSLLSKLITEASRAIDRHCAGFVNSDDYFARQTLNDVVVNGLVCSDGILMCYLPKPIVESVSAMSWRANSTMIWQSVNLDCVMIEGYTVHAYIGQVGARRVQTKVSFVGGFSSLPEDLIDAATLLSVRFYREVKSGLGDSIGVAELGTLTYTKALPMRVVEMLKPYKRVAAI